MVELVVSVGAVILISALCSLFEAVLYSVPISHIESMAQAGRTPGRILRKLRLRDVDRAISAILSLNTIANTGGALIAGTAFIRVFGEQWSVWFTVFITLAVLTFSEVIPKTVGVIHSRSLASIVARPLQFLVWSLTPLVQICRLTTRLVSRGHTEQHISEQELVAMARLGQRIGAIKADEAHVIQNILSLKSKIVRDVMTPRTVVFSLSGRLTVAEAQRKAGIWAYSRIPVYERDVEDIVGVVLRRDLFNALAERRGHVTLSELMRPVHFVVETFSLERVLKMFLERREHLSVVIDEYGGLSGVITLEDVLEEILGQEIVDEVDAVQDMRELARRRRRQILEEQ